MRGKGVFFKWFADVDAIDIELNSQSPLKIVKAVLAFDPTFNGIKLEDMNPHYS